MPHSHDDWQSRIKAVEREFLAMHFAARHLLALAQLDPTVLNNEVAVRDIGDGYERLEGTYLIRLYAEFESGLRQYWSTIRDTQPPSRDLLDGIAAKRPVPDDELANAHAVREYRNSLVHEVSVTPHAIPIKTARGFLCKYFSFLPRQW